MPDIENYTPFETNSTVVMDAEDQIRLVLICRATFSITRRAQLALCPEQLPINLAGEAHGELMARSYKYEVSGAWTKPGTDVVLIGHAWPRRSGDTSVNILFRVGFVKQLARIFGERVWFKTFGRTHPTDPLPFNRVPLTWEHAFGGWDRSADDERAHQGELRNPIGKGFRLRKSPFKEGLRLPNIESAENPMKHISDRPSPIGFGFTGPHFEPRCRFAGTYDEKWAANRSPFLPKDFNPRFFNAAPTELICSKRFRGGEPIELVNCTRRGVLKFHLPIVPPPIFRICIARREDHERTGELDTIIVNVDDGLLIMEWRATTALDSLHDLRGLEARMDGYIPPDLDVPVPDLNPSNPNG